MTSTNTSDFETEWHSLQETNRCFIVLDSNDFIVFCNNQLNAAYSPNLQRYFPPFDCFWLESEKRTFYLSEFKGLIGKETDLLFKSHQGEFVKLTVIVEEFEYGQEKYLAINTIEHDWLKAQHSTCPSTELLNELIADIDVGRVSLCYQPQFDSNSQQLYGVETLARWQRANGEFVSPEVFVELAEQYNFISILDLWVFEKACQQFSEWRKRGFNIPMIAVNFSPVSFNHPELYSSIISIIERYNIPAYALTIEITENQKIQSSEFTFDILVQLYNLGINISLDDFGMGYSNFNRLTKFPVSQLKLDRSFVFNLPNDLYREISISILLLGRSLDLVVIAEGVETNEQLKLLESFGYMIFQGYLFAKPLSVSDFEDWVSQNQTSHCVRTPPTIQR